MNDKPLTVEDYEVRQENRELKQNNGKLQFVADEQQKKIEEQERKLLEGGEIQKNLSETIATLQTKNKEAEDRYIKLNDAHTALQSTHEEAVKEGIKQKLEMGGVVETLKEKTEQQEALSQENINQKQEIENLKRENFRTKMQLSTEMKDAQAYCTELENMCDSFEEENKFLKERILPEDEMQFYYLCKVDLSCSKLGKGKYTRVELAKSGFPMNVLFDANGDAVESIQTSNYIVKRDGKHQFNISKP